MHQALHIRLASCSRQPQLGTKRRLNTFDELVEKQLVARRSIQSRQSPIQRLLQAGEEHGRVTSRCHPVSEIGELWSVDVMGPFPVITSGNHSILIMTEHLSQWIEAETVPNQRATTIIGVVMHHIVANHGVPRSGVLLRGRKCNNRTIKEWLAAKGGDPKVNLPMVLLAHRASIQPTTGKSPFMLMYGRHRRLPVGAILALLNRLIASWLSAILSNSAVGSSFAFSQSIFHGPFLAASRDAKDLIKTSHCKASRFQPSHMQSSKRQIKCTSRTGRAKFHMVLPIDFRCHHQGTHGFSGSVIEEEDRFIISSTLPRAAKEYIFPGTFYYRSLFSGIPTDAQWSFVAACAIELCRALGLHNVIKLLFTYESSGGSQTPNKRLFWPANCQPTRNELRQCCGLLKCNAPSSEVRHCFADEFLKVLATQDTFDSYFKCETPLLTGLLAETKFSRCKEGKCDGFTSKMTLTILYLRASVNNAGQTWDHWLKKDAEFYVRHMMTRELSPLDGPEIRLTPSLLGVFLCRKKAVGLALQALHRVYKGSEVRGHMNEFIKQKQQIFMNSCNNHSSQYLALGRLVPDHYGAEAKLVSQMKQHKMPDTSTNPRPQFCKSEASNRTFSGRNKNCTFKTLNGPTSYETIRKRRGLRSPQCRPDYQAKPKRLDEYNRSRFLLSRPGQPGTIKIFVLPSICMAPRHRKSVAADISVKERLHLTVV
ncbi:hypothetical protein CLF_101036 [Clonorchis sinensis]|uniref:Integrase catalytic domain-containing protein n=1 Tax=Clonorchis sinensis TaxID=79923 RepID=G7Y4U1_CLOSI|nr:hypothetical protein CLF_101036 [Clonorchis sinensis]